MLCNTKSAAATQSSSSLRFAGLHQQVRRLSTVRHLPSKHTSKQRPATRMAASPPKLDKAGLHSLPGVTPVRDPATDGFIFQQTMFRIKDPKVSLDFYTRILGFTLLDRLDFPDMKFSLYFLGYYPPDQVPDDPADRTEWMFSQPATLELTHNWGTETDPEFKGYHSGNQEPKGFGHIGFAVPDVAKACKRFTELGVKFQKRPEDGKMKNIAFITDPDGYWIEILSAKRSRDLVQLS